MDPLHIAALVYVGACVLCGCLWYRYDSRASHERALELAEAQQDAPRLVPHVGQ